MSAASKLIYQMLHGSPSAREPKVVSLAVRSGTAIRTLESELVPVDRILQRWAVSIGEGFPSEEWDDRRLSLPPPLDDELSVIVDREVMHAPPKTRRVIFEWYRTPMPAEALARKMELSRYAVYVTWRLALNYMRYRFEGTRNKGLAQILNAEVPSVL